MRLTDIAITVWSIMISIEGLPRPHEKGPVERRAISSEHDENRVEEHFQSVVENNSPEVKDLWNHNDILDSTIHACNEENAPGRYMVYCSGRLLDAVMKVRLHHDSKTFVDRPIKRNLTGEMVIERFEKRFPNTAYSKAQVEEFVNEHFDMAGGELNQCDLPDWGETTAKIEAISDITLRTFALELHHIWKHLCREIDQSVDLDPQRFSLIYVPYPFIVPGGRFRENYYWDAYWILKGLYISGMQNTAKGMIQNFAHMIDLYGFIPNGGRVYYLMRSQPPMFAAMVYDYYENTKDKKFVEEMLPRIEREITFWKNNRTTELNVNGETLTMFQYKTDHNGPRPESYREDMISSAKLESHPEKQSYFRSIASGAESGWDFSTRWMRDSELTSMETTNILPVDLNSFICYNLRILTHLHKEIGNDRKHEAWAKTFKSFRNDFQKVFYVAKEKGWYDYNLRKNEHNTNFYASISAPFYTQCYDTMDITLAEEVYDRMDEEGAFKYSGGVPTSLKNNSNQQWDFPNGWSPLNHMLIEGLRKSASPRLQQKSFKLAEKWILSNFHVFQHDKVMWEKYDVVSVHPRTGDGGEYEVQAGFGWTNGVILDLLSTFGDRLRYPDYDPQDISISRMHRSSSAESNLSLFSIVIAASLVYLYV